MSYEEKLRRRAEAYKENKKRLLMDLIAEKIDSLDSVDKVELSLSIYSEGKVIKVKTTV